MGNLDIEVVLQGAHSTDNEKVSFNTAWVANNKNVCTWAQEHKQRRSWTETARTDWRVWANMRAAAKGRTCLVLADELQEVQDSKKLGQAVVVNVLGKLAQNKGIVVI